MTTMNIVVAATATEPVRPNGIRDYVSASRLNLWLRCPLAFKLRYIEGVATPPTASLFLGKRVHAGLERYYRHRQLGVRLSPDEIEAQLRLGWEEAATSESVQFADSEEEADTREQAVRLVRAYLAQVPADEPRPLAVETSLECPLVDPATGEDLGIPLLGVVDLVLDGGEGPVVVDFKTAAKSNHPVEILHEVQLSAYSWLIRQSMGLAEAGLEIRSLVKTKTPKLESHRYASRSERHFRRFFRLVRAYLDDLDAGRLIHRPGFHCSMCEYRDACALWNGE